MTDLEEAEAAFIAATRRLDRLRIERGLGHVSLKDLAASFDNGDESGEQGQTERESESDATHGKPPIRARPRQPSWGLHVCTPRNECMMSGYRLNIRTPRWFIIVPLNPAARVYDARWVSVRSSHD